MIDVFCRFFQLTVRSPSGRELLAAFRIQQKPAANKSHPRASTNHNDTLARYLVIYRFSHCTNHHNSTYPFRELSCLALTQIATIDPDDYRCTIRHAGYLHPEKALLTCPTEGGRRYVKAMKLPIRNSLAFTYLVHSAFRYWLVVRRFLLESA